MTEIPIRSVTKPLGRFPYRFNPPSEIGPPNLDWKLFNRPDKPELKVKVRHGDGTEETIGGQNVQPLMTRSRTVINGEVYDITTTVRGNVVSEVKIGTIGPNGEVIPLNSSK